MPFTAISLDEAQRRLDRTWDGLFDYHPIRAIDNH
jgi:hypothetical protein